jgi:hypothetical protein
MPENKITVEYIKSVIKKEEYTTFGELTVCCLTLKNNFKIAGTSAPVDPNNFDIDIGKKIAYEKAFSRIWELEGYLLKDKLN